MDIAGIQSHLAGRFGATIGPVAESKRSTWIEVDPTQIDKVSAELQSHLDLKFDCLSNLSGVDYPEEGHIQVVYHLISYDLGHELTLKVNADRERPIVNTVENVWPAANWLEREVFDLLGVRFAGHSDLRRILLPDDWVGYPLRKDYVEAPEYHGISTIRESMLNIPGRN